MSDHSSAHRSARFTLDGLFSLDSLFSPEIWAVAAAIAFIILVVAGVLPRIAW
jgi:ABC-type antimicrobial peptide transport system permease subunit